MLGTECMSVWKKSKGLDHSLLPKRHKGVMGLLNCFAPFPCARTSFSEEVQKES